MSALQGMNMLMYSYTKECIPLNAPLAWFEYGSELSYCVLLTSILHSLQKIDSSFCYDVQFGTCLIMSSLNIIYFIVSGTSMNHLLISSVVRWYISLHAFSGTLVCVLSSVVRRYISFIVSGT